MKDPREFVANHVGAIPRSGIREFFAIAATMEDAISLGIGEPDFVTPWHIREAAIFALEKGKTSYTDNLGLRRLRGEISKYVAKNFGVEYDPVSEIMVGVGVSEVFDCAIRAIVNPGDKIMYHEPCFVSYSPSVRLCHGIPVAVRTRGEDGFSFNMDEVRKSWEPGCKAIVINFPTNPTGGVADAERLKELAEFFCRNLFLFECNGILYGILYLGFRGAVYELVARVFVFEHLLRIIR